MFVPRRVREQPEKNSGSTQNPVCPIEEFRDQDAWVLLGEPGAGKSESFKAEAVATGGEYIAIADFLVDSSESVAQGQTLFLDGLDETRASGSGDSILRQVRARLKKLGNPPFRIACRAADWFGSTDREILSAAVPSGKLTVLSLEPFNEEDILQVLGANHGVRDPASFITTARQRGMDGLLDNPQTLGLLAQAIQGENWPDTRQETYELAAGKLALEQNKTHRKFSQDKDYTAEQLLHAAGQLCAAMLFADKAGVALDRDGADHRYPEVAEFAPPDLALARASLHSNLFRQASTGEERMEPSHRSMAEFLAARWLAQQIDSRGLPLGRVLNLLLGIDSRTVAGLRGLYAWLALECQAARPRLIEADPLSVIIYGDVKPMPVEDKRRLLHGLKAEASRYAAFHRDVPTPHALGALVDPGLAEDFAAALQSPERDSASQAFAGCVIEILAEGGVIPSLVTVIRQIIEDASRWEHVRCTALEAWLRSDVCLAEKLGLMDRINERIIEDPDDELLGIALSIMFPEYIEVESLFSYLHVPKNNNYLGGYFSFWRSKIINDVFRCDLQVLLDWLSNSSNKFHFAFLDISQSSLSGMFDRILWAGLSKINEDISDDRLFSWLSIGADSNGNIPPRDPDSSRHIKSWLEQRPRRLKSLMKLCFDKAKGYKEFHYWISANLDRLCAAKLVDAGLWHLEQATLESNDEIAKIHLNKSVNALIFDQGSRGLTLEAIEAWGESSPTRKPWLESLLCWEIPNWKTLENKQEIARNNERDARKRERTEQLGRCMHAIRQGQASPSQMYELTCVWLNHWALARGDTPLARFASYCENPDEVLNAAESGFRLCPMRTDLPNVAEIIDLNIQQRQHLIRQPCLIGMELLWTEGAGSVESLPDDNLRRMVAFRLTYGAGKTPDWFLYLVEKRPALVAEVLVAYACSTLKSKIESVNGIYPLLDDPLYAGVAALAVQPLLASFPVRSGEGRNSNLEHLLKAALLHARDCLPTLIDRRIANKSLDVAQKVYWLATGMLLDKEKYETPLWAYVEKTRNGADHLSHFLAGFSSAGLGGSYELSAGAMGKLIELLLPHAELDWSQSGGMVTGATERGDHIRALITRLGAMATDDSRKELERLLSLPSLHKLKFSLQDALHQLLLKQRENAFRFPALSSVAGILANQAPTGAADLAALVLAYLDEIAVEIRRGNGDQFRFFWTEGEKNLPKSENSCRDVLLDKLKSRLNAFGIECLAEVDHFNDKRADIRVSFRNEFALPIEIKRDTNDSLWTALRGQLMAQYASDPKSDGHGIYLVLWFGKKGIPRVTDGGKTPITPEELQTRLEAQLDPVERKRVFVRVLDVSWPQK